MKYSKAKAPPPEAEKRPAKPRKNILTVGEWSAIREANEQSERTPDATQQSLLPDSPPVVNE